MHTTCTCLWTLYVYLLSTSVLFDIFYLFFFYLVYIFYLYLLLYFFFFFFFSSRRRHTISTRDWSSDVCSSDLTWRRYGSCRSSTFARTICITNTRTIRRQRQGTCWRAAPRSACRRKA